MYSTPGKFCMMWVPDSCCVVLNLMITSMTDLPSSLPIASAYGGYPAYDPYAGYYGYSYGYGDPYAVYGGQPYAMPNGMQPQFPSSEAERQGLARGIQTLYDGCYE